MKIHVLKNGLTEIENVNPEKYKQWKKYYTKHKTRDVWLNAPIPILYDYEYSDFMNYTQDALINELLK